MSENIYIGPEDIDVINSEEFSSDISKCFSTIPEVGHPLIDRKSVV